MNSIKPRSSADKWFQDELRQRFGEGQGPSLSRFLEAIQPQLQGGLGS
jgi:hypothetical protein